MKKKRKNGSGLLQLREKSSELTQPEPILVDQQNLDAGLKVDSSSISISETVHNGHLKRRSGSLHPLRGAEGFEARYSTLFGDRWGTIKQSFSKPNGPVGLEIHSAGSYSITENGSGQSLEVKGSIGMPLELCQTESENYKPYWLDRISVFAAESLFMKENSLVLDACAAPGGKTLVLAARLPPGARLVANELSPDRRRRLTRVISEHLPPDIAALVRITGRDAATLCKDGRQEYDAILLDVPCSSERHVYGNSSALKEWSPARVKNLTYRQWALLSSSWRMLKTGGCLVYSTCSISPEENEEMLDKLERKYCEEIDWNVPSYPGAETRGRGLIFLPDRMEGSGPLFVGRMIKR